MELISLELLKYLYLNHLVVQVILLGLADAMCLRVLREQDY